MFRARGPAIVLRDGALFLAVTVLDARRNLGGVAPGVLTFSLVSAVDAPEKPRPRTGGMRCARGCPEAGRSGSTGRRTAAILRSQPWRRRWRREQPRTRGGRAELRRARGSETRGGRASSWPRRTPTLRHCARRRVCCAKTVRKPRWFALPSVPGMSARVPRARERSCSRPCARRGYSKTTYSRGISHHLDNPLRFSMTTRPASACGACSSSPRGSCGGRRRRRRGRTPSRPRSRAASWRRRP